MAAGSIIIDLLMNTGSFETSTERAAIGFKKLKNGLFEIRNETEVVTAKFDSLMNTWKKVESTQNQFTSAVQKNQGAFRTSNQVIQNTSYQLTDFVVQVQGGVSAMRAFSQQAPQFLGAFGPKGAALGIFAALGGAIGDMVLKSLDIKDTAKAFDDLKVAAEGVASAISLTTQIDLSGLGKNYNDATIEGKRLIDANVTLSMLMLEMSKIDATEAFRGGIQKSLDDLGFFTKAFNLFVNSAKYARDVDVGGFQQGPVAATQFADITGITESQANEIDRQQKAFAAGSISAGTYLNTLNGIAEQYKTKMNPEFKKFYEAQGIYATRLEKERNLQDALTKARENNYQGLQKANSSKSKNTLEKMFENQRVGADKFIESMQRSNEQVQFQTGLLGRNAQEVEVLNAQYKIQAELQKTIQDIERQNGTIRAEELEKMKAAAEAAMAIQTAAITSRQQMERSASYGMEQSMRSYVDNAGNMAKNLEGAFTNAFKGMEDGIVQFAMTGKMNFADFANSVIADIMRIYVRMAIAGLVGQFAGSFSTTPGTSSNPTYQGPPSAPVRGYAEGGYTGDGGKYQPAGVVHAGEFVMNKDATSRIGVGNLYRMMRGYADGGLVGSAPLAGGSMAGNVTINVKNEAGGDGYQATATARKNDSGIDIDIMVRKAVNADLMRNGPMAQQMSSVFNLRRQS